MLIEVRGSLSDKYWSEKLLRKFFTEKKFRYSFENSTLFSVCPKFLLDINFEESYLSVGNFST